MVSFSFQLFRDISSKLVKIKSGQSGLKELQAPVTICGDIHGQLADLLTIFKTFGWPPANSYVFLGNAKVWVNMYEYTLWTKVHL